MALLMSRADVLRQSVEGVPRNGASHEVSKFGQHLILYVRNDVLGACSVSLGR